MTVAAGHLRPIVLCVVMLAPALRAGAQPVPLEVRVSPPTPEVGDVVQVQVAGPASLISVAVRAGSQRVVMRPDGPARWIGLLGIDIDAKLGPMAVAATAAMTGDATAAVDTTLTVRARTFTERRLRFPPRMADPSPADLARARDEAARLETIFKAETAPAWDGRFVRPVEGRVTSTFGTRTFLNGRRRGRHVGVDLAGQTGTPVSAPNAGRVVLADDLFYSGNTVVVDHGGGLFSFFGHLSRIDVAVEDLVTTGAVIGTVGATGRVTGPHLHWAMRLSGARVDPLRMVSVVGYR